MNLKPLSEFAGNERKLLGIFGIDVGNHDTKTRHETFSSGYQKVKVINKLSGEYIAFKDKYGDPVYYTFSNKPFNLSFNKTDSEEMFLITLMAIAREAVARGISINGEEIALAIGMPPGTYNQINIDKYYNYYMERGKIYHIDIAVEKEAMISISMLAMLLYLHSAGEPLHSIRICIEKSMRYIWLILVVAQQMYFT